MPASNQSSICTRPILARCHLPPRLCILIPLILAGTSACHLCLSPQLTWEDDYTLSPEG